jgi:aldehyde dehydrogenase (NAD+)
MLEFDPDRTSFPKGHFIGGVLVDGEGEVLEVRRPVDGMGYAEGRSMLQSSSTAR